jgi:hypothetical protein
MPTTKVSVEVSAAPKELWQLIGGSGSLPDWVPRISQSELTDGGRVRHLHDPQGHTFVEKLERYDSAAHSYSYSIVKSPVPVSNYLSTLQVTPIEGGKRSRRMVKRLQASWNYGAKSRRYFPRSLLVEFESTGFRLR